MARQFTISLDYKTVLPVLAAFLLGLGIGWWQPWTTNASRTITVTGDATITAVPDEYVFYPSFVGTGTTANQSTEDARTQGDAAVEEIKQIGVSEEKIKSDIQSSPYYGWDGREEDEYQTYYSLTITVSDKEIAQKVQNYLLTTENVGSSSPQSGFSEAKNTELKSEARKRAVENARNQGDTIAAEIDTKVSKVISIEEVTGFDTVYPMHDMAVTSSRASEDTVDSSALLVGEQDLTFSVKVVFSVK